MRSQITRVPSFPSLLPSLVHVSIQRIPLLLSYLLREVLFPCCARHLCESPLPQPYSLAQPSADERRRRSRRRKRKRGGGRSRRDLRQLWRRRQWRRRAWRKRRWRGRLGRRLREFDRNLEASPGCGRGRRHKVRVLSTLDVPCRGRLLVARCPVSTRGGNTARLEESMVNVCVWFRGRVAYQYGLVE